MKNLSKKQIVAGIILCVLILSTIVFIFTNSTKNTTESSEQSGIIVEIIKPIVDANNSIPEDKFEIGIRKLAHFLEFMLLSMEITSLCLLLYNKTPNISFSCLIILFIIICALIDETIQIYSLRGSSVIDVLIDTLGGCFGIAFTVLVFVFINQIIKQLKTKKKSTEIC